MAEPSDSTVSYTPMQSVKRYFFAMRNGVIADTLRKGGSPFRYIFGLNLPQLVEAAAMFGKDKELAVRLWANNTTRESMLLAPMLMPADDFSADEAKVWIASVPAPEVADILCHRLLRHLAYAPELAVEFADFSHGDMERYTAGRLALNLFDRVGFVASCVLSRLERDAGPYAKAIAHQIAVRFEDL